MSVATVKPGSWEKVEADAKKIAKNVAQELGQFFVKQAWRRGCRDQIDTERPVGPLADRMNLLLDELRRFAHHTQKPEPAGIGNGGGKICPGNTAHTGLQDWITTSENAAKVVVKIWFAADGRIHPFHSFPFPIRAALRARTRSRRLVRGGIDIQRHVVDWPDRHDARGPRLPTQVT